MLNINGFNKVPAEFWEDELRWAEAGQGEQWVEFEVNDKIDLEYYLQTQIKNTRSTVIVTQSCDIESASDFIANTFQSDDLFQIRVILVQASVEAKLVELLKTKLKTVQSAGAEETFKKLEGKGFEIIRSIAGVPSIVKCPENLIVSDDLPIVNLEVFRTTKEAISFAKASTSIGLWCDNLSIAFEYCHSLKNARQIWLNSSHGMIHPKIPFFNGKVVCEDGSVAKKAEGSIIEIKGNVQFQTTFHGENSYQTVVIPFGETFANWNFICSRFELSQIKIDFTLKTTKNELFYLESTFFLVYKH